MRTGEYIGGQKVRSFIERAIDDYYPTQLEILVPFRTGRKVTVVAYEGREKDFGGLTVRFEEVYFRRVYSRTHTIVLFSNVAGHFDAVDGLIREAVEKSRMPSKKSSEPAIV